MEFRARYGPWALVTGAGQGLGAAYAGALAARGLDLFLIDRRADDLAAVAETARRAHGVRVDTLVLELAEGDAVERITRATAQHEIGLLVSNAAASPIGEFHAQSAALHHAVVTVNCLVPALLAHHFGRAMRARRRGGLILMASLAGFQGNPFVAHYAATKAYNLVLAEGLWDECRAHGVDVLACCPGATRTPGYLVARPPSPGRFAPPEMEPADVVREALAALGQTPSMVPGRGNRLGAFVVQRLMSRAQAIRMMGSVGRRLQTHD